ncbi:MBOAT family O-acyltransferase [Anaeromyxobacter dehalogenans]|nr:MBOAT family O-acyltransferase [Anaeromyxobacter dehalogenans]
MPHTWSFDYFYSLPFWAALLAVAAVVRLAGGSPVLRGLALLATSNALLLAIPGFSAADLALVWAVSGVALASARTLSRSAPGSSRARRVVVVGSVVAILAFLALFKYRFLQGLLLGPFAQVLAPRASSGVVNPLVLVGVSYFSFKAIHVVVETYRGTLGRVEALAFLNYMTFFPAFISGPINRFGDFSEQLASASPALGADLRAGGERIVHGLFKKVVLVPLVMPYLLTNQARPLDQATLLDVATGLYAYALYFFFDFAGYTDLAIGGARIIGIRLPENFRQPFFQKNIRDLWTNWHMTLTSWLVDYVYWPTVRALRNLEYLRTRPVLLSVIGMNVTFVSCGIWHGEAPHFVLWGAYHGLGISVLNVYQRQKKRIRAPRIQRWFASRYSRWLGTFATFNFFAAGLALFVLDLGQIRALLRALVG